MTFMETHVIRAEDGSVALLHGPSKSNFTIDKDGNHVHDTKGKGLRIKVATIALQGNATLNSLPIRTDG